MNEDINCFLTKVKKINECSEYFNENKNEFGILNNIYNKMIKIEEDLENNNIVFVRKEYNDVNKFIKYSFIINDVTDDVYWIK